MNKKEIVKIKKTLKRAGYNKEQIQCLIRMAEEHKLTANSLPAYLLAIGFGRAFLLTAIQTDLFRDGTLEKMI